MPDAPPGTLPAGTRLGHYEIARLIGEGGMGQVWPVLAKLSTR